MPKRWALWRPSPNESVALQRLIALTESQILSASALIETLNVDLEKNNEKRGQLEAEIVPRRQSLVEWARSRDFLSKALQELTLLAQSRPRGQYTPLAPASRTATPPDGELALKLAEQDNNDIDAIRTSLETRELTISVLRSRVAVLEEDIAGCEAASSHTRSMLTWQTSHKDQLQILLKQYTLRLHPLFRLPDTALQEIFLHVTELSWEQWKHTVAKKWSLVGARLATFPRYPTIALTAVCHRWRTIATDTPELWSKVVLCERNKDHSIPRLAHYIHLARKRPLSVLVGIRPLWGDPDIQPFQFVKSSNVTLDTLILTLSRDRYYAERAMKILPSPRRLFLWDRSGDFLSTSLPQEFLTRTEELYAEKCRASIESPAPTLRRFELDMEHIRPSSITMHYIPSVLQRLPHLDYLSIQYQTPSGSNQPPSLIASPGVCESVTWLEIPLMALRGPLEGLQSLFRLPNLARLSLVRFLQEGSDLQAWRNFVGLNGGKIRRLDLDAHFPDGAFPHKERENELAEHLRNLASVRHISLPVCFAYSVALTLLLNVTIKKGKGKEDLLIPNMETCEIRGTVKDKTQVEGFLRGWSHGRRDNPTGEAAGKHGVEILWT